MMDKVREKYEKKAKSREWIVLAMMERVIRCMKGNYGIKKEDKRIYLHRV